MSTSTAHASAQRCGGHVVFPTQSRQVISKMKPIIIDESTGQRLWTSAEAAANCGLSIANWQTHVGRSAPQPVARLDQSTPLWDPREVKFWHATRPKTGWKPRAY